MHFVKLFFFHCDQIARSAVIMKSLFSHLSIVYFINWHVLILNFSLDSCKSVQIDALIKIYGCLFMIIIVMIPVNKVDMTSPIKIQIISQTQFRE